MFPVWNISASSFQVSTTEDLSKVWIAECDGTLLHVMSVGIYMYVNNY